MKYLNIQSICSGMKKFGLIFLIWGFNFAVNSQTIEKLKDPRDGKVYSTVKIGSQVWMAQNLAFEPKDSKFWTFDVENNQNIGGCGYYYTWETARNVCPPGWKLPSRSDWEVLKSFLGNNTGEALKSISEWSSNSSGNDNYGFNGLPCGCRYTSGKQGHVGKYAYWWADQENGNNYAWYFYLQHDYNNLLGDNFGGKTEGFSVRCIKR